MLSTFLPESFFFLFFLRKENLNDAFYTLRGRAMHTVGIMLRAAARRRFRLRLPLSFFLAIFAHDAARGFRTAPVLPAFHAAIVQFSLDTV